MSRLAGRLVRLFSDTGLLSLLATVAFLALAAVTPGTIRDLLASIASSFLFVAIVALVQWAHSLLRHRHFLGFFGEEMFTEGISLVYPDFVLHNDVMSLLSDRNRLAIYARPGSRFAPEATRTIDLPRALAANDIQALLYMWEAFGNNPQARPEMLADSAVIQECDRSFISFGLSSNDCTLLYLRHTETPLFQLLPDGLGSEYIRLTNGSEYRDNEDSYWGIILRYRPDPTHHPRRMWFLCAGLGSRGTTGAAWYASRSWRELYAVTGPVEDFLAVIQVPISSDRLSRLHKVVTLEGELPLGQR